MRRVLAAVLVSLGLASFCLAQGATNRDADHDALRGLMKKVVQAINERDMKVLGACFAKEFVFTAIDQTVITNEEQLKAFNDKIFAGKDAPMKKIEIKPEADTLTKFLADNVGYCVGKSTETYTMKDNRAFTMVNRWTATVVKEGGEWKIAAVHSGVNFMDNPILTAKSMSFWHKVGVALHLSKAPWDKAK
jgi:ketosteroid isomerase-like protein